MNDGVIECKCLDCGADVYEIWDVHVLVDDLKRRKEQQNGNRNKHT